MLMLVKAAIEMTHHIQCALQPINYCILYLYLVVSTTKKSVGKNASWN